MNSDFTHKWYSEDNDDCRSTFRTAVHVFAPVMILYTSTTSGSKYADSTVDYDATTNTTTVSSGTIYANAISIYWQAEDLALFESSYASALPSELSIETAATSTPTGSGRPVEQAALPGGSAKFPDPTFLSSSSSSPSDNSLSVGEIVGVVPGSVTGATFLALAAFLILRRRKRRAAEAGTPEAKHMTSVEAPELVEYENPGRAVGRESYQP
jgi:hypothetical protein